jgi:hypothetical protein
MKLTMDWKNIVIGIATFLLVLLGFQYNNKVGTLNQEIVNKEQLMIAMNDSMRTVIDENGDLKSTKKTLQANLKELKGLNKSLTLDQNKLIDKVAKTSKKNTVITAALIKTQAELEKIKGKTNFKNDTTLVLTMDTDSLSYEIEVTGVALSADSAQHEIVSLKIPNEQYVEFKWGNKKEGYPISFSVTNTSPYMKTYNIESYALPEIKKDELKPTLFQKVDKFFGDNRKPFIIGVGVGAALMIIAN